MWPFSRGGAVDAPIASISAREAVTRMKHGAKLIDVRSTREFRALHPKSSISVPPELIKQDRVGLERDTEILVICMSGRRSLRQARKLTGLGYTNVANVAGGLNYWAKFGLPVKRSR
jgi:rhodanese-related sulfurtransferase